MLGFDSGLSGGGDGTLTARRGFLSGGGADRRLPRRCCRLTPAAHPSDVRGRATARGDDRRGGRSLGNRGLFPSRTQSGLRLVQVWSVLL